MIMNITAIIISLDKSRSRLASSAVSIEGLAKGILFDFENGDTSSIPLRCEQLIEHAQRLHDESYTFPKQVENNR